MTDKIDSMLLLSDHRKFRLRAPERIAAEIEASQLGIEATYLVGSVKGGNPGPSSDIDLLIHFEGSEQQRSLLLAWLDGWRRCLDEIIFLATGRRTGVCSMFI